MQTLVENSYYVNKIQGLELAAEAYVKKENRKIEYQNQEKIYEEVRTRYDHTKGIFPQYVMFLIFGSIHGIYFLLAGVPVLIKTPFDGSFEDLYVLVPISIILMIALFCFIGGAFISKTWHRNSKKNSYAYKQALGSQYGFLSNQKSYLDAAERTWHDCCVTNGIPFDATLEDVNRLLDEARVSQQAYFNSLDIEAAERSRIKKEEGNQNIINFSDRRAQSAKNNIPRHLIIDDCDTIYDYEDEADDVIYEDDDENYDSNSSYFEDLRNEDDELSHERHVREREEWQRDYDETMEDFILGF